MRARTLAWLLPLIALAGCHSPFVQATITNQGPPLHTVELDYPSQSFGTQTLATNQVFHYRFKVQGSGPLKLQFVDPAGKVRSATGPSLHDGAEGTLAVTINPHGEVAWVPNLSSPSQAR